MELSVVTVIQHTFDSSTSSTTEATAVLIEAMSLSVTLEAFRLDTSIATATVTVSSVVGSAEGSAVGRGDGLGLGSGLGTVVGVRLGSGDGGVVGMGLGNEVGIGLGGGEGRSVGTGEGPGVGHGDDVGADEGAPNTSPCAVWKTSTIGAHPENDSPLVSSNSKQISECSALLPLSTIVWTLSSMQK